MDIPAIIAAQTHSRDPGDDKFIHTALAARAALLVSADRDLLEAPAIPELRILPPAAALGLPEFVGGRWPRGREYLLGKVWGS